MMTLTALPKPQASFFWTAPFQDDSEFQPLDPLALDYLGQQVGLWMFPGFTTRTNRAQYYAVVLYGLHLVDEALRAYQLPNDDETRVSLFERWERFWAMAVLTYREGALERGDPDAMRGVRGAARAWFSGDRPLPLDYVLISRQEELGGLGAYLSSLRHYQLVIPGTYQPTREHDEIVAAFWDEPDTNAKHRAYEAYALAALDPSQSRIERKHGNITLAEVGRRTRLSSLHERKRTVQQARLFDVLFTQAKGPTPVLGRLLEEAWNAGVRDAGPFIEECLAGRWGALDEPMRELLVFARAFRNAAFECLSAFNALYTHIVDMGWMAPAEGAFAKVFEPTTLENLRRACGELLETSLIHRFRNLPVHASGFVRMATRLRQCHAAADAAEAMLAYHATVRTERRQGGSWMVREGDKLVIDAISWGGIRGTVPAPSFRIHTVQSLLQDVGRIA